MNQKIKFVDEIAKCKYCNKEYDNYFIYEKNIYCRNCLKSLITMIEITLNNF